jgi:hypothetical protein
MKGRDNLGHFIGALVIGNEQAFLSAIDSYVNSALNPATTSSPDKRRKLQLPPLRLPKLPPVTLPKVKVPPLPKVDVPKLKEKIKEAPPKLKEKIKEAPKALDRKLKDLVGPDKRAARQHQQQQQPRSDALRLFDYLFGS